MSSRGYRRLVADHNSLYADGLPLNYLFPPNADSFADDLSKLDVILAGPHATPYADGAWRVHLNIPRDYPAAPPKAFFRTKIWHPNVEEASGSVCVDTLKRDWESRLTLRDVLVTISCLLIHPNPASALNAEAGALLQEDFNAFSKRAKLMTDIHAKISSDLTRPVFEAKTRGEQKEMLQSQRDSSDFSALPTPPLSSSNSGLGIQGYSLAGLSVVEDDDDLKENSASYPVLPSASRPTSTNPYRQGPPVPLAELDFSHESDVTLYDVECNSSDAEMAFSSEQNIMNNLTCQDDKTSSKLSLSEDPVPFASKPLFNGTSLDPSSPLFPVSSLHLSKSPVRSPTKSSGLIPHLSAWGSVSKPRNMSSQKSPPRGNLAQTLRKRPCSQSNDEETRKRRTFEDKLWKLAGGDIQRYNRGDFGPKRTAFDRI